MKKKLFMEIVKIQFEIDPFKKKCLLEGLDDIALSLKKSDKIENLKKFKKSKALDI